MLAWTGGKRRKLQQHRHPTPLVQQPAVFGPAKPNFYDSLLGHQAPSVICSVRPDARHSTDEADDAIQAAKECEQAHHVIQSKQQAPAGGQAKAPDGVNMSMYSIQPSLQITAHTVAVAFPELFEAQITSSTGSHKSSTKHQTHRMPAASTTAPQQPSTQHRCNHVEQQCGGSADPDRQQLPGAGQVTCSSDADRAADVQAQHSQHVPQAGPTSMQRHKRTAAIAGLIPGHKQQQHSALAGSIDLQMMLGGWPLTSSCQAQSTPPSAHHA